MSFDPSLFQVTSGFVLCGFSRSEALSNPKHLTTDHLQLEDLQGALLWTPPGYQPREPPETLVGNWLQLCR